MVKLTGTFSQLQSFKVLIVGDFMLDRYTNGTVQRISPEAPVSILKVENEQSLPGGAGNVALNLVSLGAQEVVALGRVGSDLVGQELLEKLEIEGVNVDYFVAQTSFPTPIKNRLVAEGQQLLRVDREKVIPIDEDLEKEIIETLPHILSNVDVVAVSDYNKGFLSNALLQALLKKAKELSIPVIVDPKGDDFAKYLGATLIKPNQCEAYTAAKLPNSTAIDEVAKELFSICHPDKLVITRSKEGISLFEKGKERQDFSVQIKEVKDVTGAGDTVLAMLSACVANKIDMENSIRFANIAAGLAIEKVGCARIGLSEFARRLLEIDLDNKIFDESHLFALKKILINREYTLFALKGKQVISSELLRSIQKLTQENKELIIYLQEDEPDEELINFLSCLKEVSFIILKKESLNNLYKNLKPQSAYLFSNNDMQNIILTELSNYI
ncbi:MAG: HldE protein [Chlamydiae bacterium CG10_big_fil_rev_8_21_14_0_10_35_9]|nr:MAG: HldE protein [Chlamydiae bacterium CG10_big_fil_rev_8_21_14_0_10_35_9]